MLRITRCFQLAALAAAALLLCSGCSSDDCSCPQEDTGSVMVNPAPDTISASWLLASADGGATAGSGDQTVSELADGDYTLNWGDVPGWITPPAETKTLVAGETLTFNGTYIPDTAMSTFELVTPLDVFVMGSPDNEAGRGDEEVEHPVLLSTPYYIFSTEVTNQQYAELAQWAYDNDHCTVSGNSLLDALDGSTEVLLNMADSDCEISFSGVVFTVEAGKGTHPVKEVTWFGAVAYCDWLSLRAGWPRAYDHANWTCNDGDPYTAVGYRLPTDSEWEYAARYDDERIYPWGDESPNCSLANFFPEDYCVGSTTSVGIYPAAPVIEGEGLYDMAGNVWEWCNDWAQCDLGTTPESDPTGPISGTKRVLRGGYWVGSGAALRCAFRSSRDPSSSSAYGIRLARSVIPS